MSDYEPSYYEIALTNRQVLVAFVILLACLLGSFFAGVWVGRDEAEAAGPAVAEEPVEEPGGPAELDFFADGELEEMGDEMPVGDVPRDPAEVRAEREARRPAAGPDLAGGEGAALGRDAPAQRPPEPVAPPADRDEPVDRASSAAPEAATVPAPVEATSGPMVQVLSTADREQAEKVASRLDNAGFDVTLASVQVDGRTMYRVRLGPYGDRAEAERVAERVRRELRLDTWIVQ
ncbi:MAG TPA: SPOR domain-containing protein [Thermoanaerobaculia bacterium]|nr:SPOR domain-containing protein [Thermoanaerobaculia bacterium]